MRNISTSTYVENNRLYVLGMAPTPLGPVPFSYHANIDGDVPDGPIAPGSEDSNPLIKQAFEASSEPIMNKINEEQLKLAAENLVIRSRQGDENAMALIVGVRKAAANKGNQKAQMAYALLQDYIKRNPHDSRLNPRIGGEITPSSNIFSGHKRAVRGDVLALVEKTLKKPTSTVKYAAIVNTFIPNSGNTLAASSKAATVIANGPRINKHLMLRLAKSLHKEDRTSFMIGIRLANHSNQALKLLRRLPEATKRALHIGYVVGLARILQYVRNPNTEITPVWADVGYELGE